MSRRAPRGSFEYAGERLREVAFPLGGIGSGCVSLEGRGALRDWEIFNRPNKGSILPLTFPLIWWPGGCKVAQGPRQKDFVGDSLGFWGYGHGQIRNQGDGLPHFSEARFRGTFPTARVRLRDANCPLQIDLTAWSPFVPGDVRSSCFPVACLTYSVKNPTGSPVPVSLAWSLMNAVGTGEPSPNEPADLASQRFVEDGAVRGLLFENGRFAPGDPRHGTLALATDWRRVTYLKYLLRGEWFDSLHDLWDMFSREGELDQSRDLGPGAPVPGVLALQAEVPPAGRVELPFVIAWCFPVSEKYWDRQAGDAPYCWRNPYSRDWPDAWSAAKEFLERKGELWRRTRAFARSIFSLDLPVEVKESVSATASVLRSPTCLFQEDGTFWAWEGCSAKAGCCAGSCTHVWNYALTHAYLFPELQRSMRRSEYLYGFARNGQGNEGAIAFRIPLPLTDPPKLWHAASDGQLGGVVQLYRDWRICGSDRYLREMWPHARRALEYAWVQWDRDCDGLVDGDQHNTYDINFQGPNPLTQSFYLAALRAAEEICVALGNSELASRYRALFEAGSKLAVDAMFNGEYFEQALDCLGEDAPKYQHGKGCLSDQLLGQWSAHVAGLGYLYPREVVRKVLESIYKYNFKSPLGEHANMQRVYALSDESGLVLCTWPRGGRPRFPFPYSDECWTGVEYHVASHLIFEGMIEEGLAIVRAVRARHDGRRRNPYNEFECGSHYARALSAWGLKLAFELRQLD